MAALLLKVFTLAVRTLARPFGDSFQAWALRHETFRKQCIGAAQMIHRVEVRMSRGAEGKNGKAFIGDMTEEKAMELASRLVSEGFVFTVGAAAVVWEYNRSRSKALEERALEQSSQDQIVDEAIAERELWQQEKGMQAELLHKMVCRIDSLEGQLLKMQEERLRQNRIWWRPWAVG